MVHGVVVVVAAAGNYGTDGRPAGVLYAPANDPFVITVGAADINGYDRDRRRLRRAVVGVRLDAGRLREARAVRARARPRGPGARRVDDRDRATATGSSRPATPGCSGHVVRRPGRRRRRGLRPRAPPELDARPGQGRAHATAGPIEATLTTSPGVGEIKAAKASSFASPPNPNQALNQFLEASQRRHHEGVRRRRLAERRDGERRLEQRHVEPGPPALPGSSGAGLGRLAQRRLAERRVGVRARPASGRSRPGTGRRRVARQASRRGSSGDGHEVPIPVRVPRRRRAVDDAVGFTFRRGGRLRGRWTSPVGTLRREARLSRPRSRGRRRRYLGAAVHRRGRRALALALTAGRRGTGPNRRAGRVPAAAQVFVVQTPRKPARTTPRSSSCCPSRALLPPEWIRGSRRCSTCRSGEGALPLVHPGLQHRDNVLNLLAALVSPT